MRMLIGLASSRVFFAGPANAELWSVTVRHWRIDAETRGHGVTLQGRTRIGQDR